MQRRTCTGSPLLVVLGLAATLIFGCSGGNGPSLPSPERGDVIDTEEFIVEAGEEVRYDSSTTIRAQTARIDGEVICGDGSAPGDDGPSITIEAEGYLTISGSIRAGDGWPGGADEAGGNGGSIFLRSTGGDITVGQAAQSEALPAQAGAGQLVAGDGAAGGDGLTGGAGGAGGSITLECPNGTLTLDAAEGLLHRGNGGDGGRGVVGGQDILALEAATELTNSGGNGGRLHVDCAELFGVETVQSAEQYEGAPVFVAWLDPGTMTGGAGGDAGDFYLGIDPDTGESSWPAEVAPADLMTKLDGREELTMTALNGGDSDTHGGNGGDVHLDFSDAVMPGEGTDGGYIFGVGGDGGGVTVDPSGPLGDAWALIVSRDNISVGSGGDAIVKAPNGTRGGPGQNGGAGGGARAEGGAAGQVSASMLEYDDSMVVLGVPGIAEAYGGGGGNGGSLCVVTQSGGNGGKGGDATAVGGIGPRWNTILYRGGAAMAVSGDGGNGGMGTPPGTGGRHGLATAAGGIGMPDGEAIRRQGEDGADGGPCPTPTVSYDVSFYAPGHTYEYCSVVRILPDVFDGIIPRQGGQVILGNRDNNPIVCRAGQTMAFTPNADRLFIGAVDNQGILIYDDPMSGGDRPPAAALLPSTPFAPTSLWYDTARDQLYVAVADNVLVWHGASNISGNPQPNRIIGVTGLGVPSINCITGDPGRDILYVAAGTKFHALDNASGLDGPAPVDRTGNTGQDAGRSLACDPSRDIIYAGGNDPLSNNHHVLVIGDASSASGSVQPLATIWAGTGDNWPVALAAFGEVDELLVAVVEDGLFLYRNASQLADGATPEYELPVGLYAMGARRH